MRTIESKQRRQSLSSEFLDQSECWRDLIDMEIGVERGKDEFCCHAGRIG